MVAGLAGKVDAQLAEGLLINPGKDDGGMGLQPFEFFQLLHCQFGPLIGGGANGKSDQNLIGMQARIVIAEVLGTTVSKLTDIED